MEQERDDGHREKRAVEPDLLPSATDDRRLFVPGDDWTLLRQGAEARLWKVPQYRTTHSVAICKERFAKKYRHPTLDARLTKKRCTMEARLLQKCISNGIRVPQLLQVDSSFANSTAVIYMEFIDGITVRDFLEEELLPQLDAEPNYKKGRLFDLAENIGSTVAQLHASGMVHGDLTTSNMMKSEKDSSSLVLIDFGLAKNATATEERAVDLYVLERALQSTHPTLPATFLERLLSAYASSSQSGDTLTRLEKVRQRGRKRECFG